MPGLYPLAANSTSCSRLNNRKRLQSLPNGHRMALVEKYLLNAINGDISNK